jgi:hypothetical protein
MRSEAVRSGGEPAAGSASERTIPVAGCIQERLSRGVHVHCSADGVRDNRTDDGPCAVREREGAHLEVRVGTEGDDLAVSLIAVVITDERPVARRETCIGFSAEAPRDVASPLLLA